MDGCIRSQSLVGFSITHGLAKSDSTPARTLRPWTHSIGLVLTSRRATRQMPSSMADERLETYSTISPKRLEPSTGLTRGRLTGVAPILAGFTIVQKHQKSLSLTGFTTGISTAGPPPQGLQLDLQRAARTGLGTRLQAAPREQRYQQHLQTEFRWSITKIILSLFAPRQAITLTGLMPTTRFMTLQEQRYQDTRLETYMQLVSGRSFGKLHMYQIHPRRISD